MNSFQRRIQKFSNDRDWNQFHNPKDLLLGIVEEIGEIRNLVKWEQDRNKLQKVLAKNRTELEDNIGDIYWFLALLANANGIDLDEAINKVIKRNEKRFPTRKVKSRHTNRYFSETPPTGVGGFPATSVRSGTPHRKPAGLHLHPQAGAWGFLVRGKK